MPQARNSSLAHLKWLNKLCPLPNILTFNCSTGYGFLFLQAFLPLYTFNLFPTSVSTCTSNAHLLYNIEFLQLDSFLDLMPPPGVNKSLGITESGGQSTRPEFLAPSTTSELNETSHCRESDLASQHRLRKGWITHSGMMKTLAFHWGQFCPKEKSEME